MGLVTEGTCIERKYDIYPKTNGKPLSYKDFDAIQKEFKENGFNVTLTAIKHNYECWLEDFKSGYRDERNNYHLFSPCGCNPLSFRATTLHKQCEDWQQTYFG